MRLRRGTLEGPILAALPALSSTGEFRLVCESGQLQVSIAGGPFVPIATGGPSPWTQTGAGAGGTVELADAALGEVVIDADVVRIPGRIGGPQALVVTGDAANFNRNVMVRAPQGFRLAKSGSWETRNIGGGGNLNLDTAWAHFNKITVTGAGAATVTLAPAGADTEGFFVHLINDPGSLDDIDVGPGLVTLVPGERAIVVSSIVAWEWF